MLNFRTQPRWGAKFGGWAIMIVVVGFGLQPLLRGDNSESQGRRFRLPLRAEVQVFKGSGLWQAAQLECEFSTRETAIVICDMWDKHWCTGAATRVDELARRMEPVLEACRGAGILIIHAPSDTMEFYKGYPQRRAMLLVSPVNPPTSLGLSSPALPIDDSDRGCENPEEKEHIAWTRENALLSMHANDLISDNGSEIYSLLEQRGIKNLLIMGVHANMCILNRSFAIKQMTNWGVRCVLVRDLTDAQYNPRSWPYVSHAEGTELVIQYIEKYWCPSALSGDLVNVLR